VKRIPGFDEISHILPKIEDEVLIAGFSKHILTPAETEKDLPDGTL